MQTKIFFILFILVSFSARQSTAQLIAFPGAEGAGKFVTGGRGSAAVAPKIFEVTSLVDNASAATTPGTLRYACTNNSPSAPNRIIVFRVSGTIHLYANLNISRANTTIAGQTAPGGGITIADYPVYLSANNIIVRYMRFRLGDKNQAASLGNDDAFGDNGSGKSKLMIDHCTASWSNDEALTIYSGDSITIQWCMISEPLDSSYHDEGTGVQNHAYGGIQSGRHASLHHNLYAHCKGRMPRFDGIRNISADTADFRNNVVYNWGEYNTCGGEGGTYNVVNNYYKYGPNTASTSVSGVNKRNMLIDAYKSTSPVIPYGKYFLTGNFCYNSTTVTNRNWLGAVFSGGSLTDSVNSKVDFPFSCININTQSALQAYNDVLANVGASLPYRDTLDQRIVTNVINGTGKIINCQGGFPRGTDYTINQIAWPFLPTGTTPTDTDHDGMPDNWESQRGLNPNSPADMNQYISNTGYNNVENYLNGDTITAPGTLNSMVDAKAVNSSATNSWLHSKDTSYSDYRSSKYLVSADTNNLVASLYDNAIYGNVKVSYFTTASIRRNSNNIPYLNRTISIVPQGTLSTSSPVTIRLYISKKEFDDLKAVDNTISSIANLRVLVTADTISSMSLSNSYSMITPQNTGVFGSYNNGYFIEFQTSSFGTFYFTGPSMPLPLRIISFSSVLQKNKVQNKWITHEEANLNYFSLEKSADGKFFVPIQNLKAHNNWGLNNYQQEDPTPFFGVTYYRLKAVEQNNQFFYSQINTIYRKPDNDFVLETNPFSNYLQVVHTTAAKGDCINIYSFTGQQLFHYDLLEGSFRSKIATNNLAPGVYILEYTNQKGKIRIKGIKL